MESILNLTGRNIIVGQHCFKSNGNIKLSQSIQKIGEYDGIDIIKSSFGDAILPERTEGVGIIVSHIVCQKFTDRDDLYIVGGKLKDNNGIVIGAQHLIFNPYFKNNGGPTQQ